MQKTRYYPFERNRYFYGKLLTVRDFETEQKYVGDKRKMLNRLLYGSGIVAGLHVVKVDDKTISVKPGIALDRSGREIVVASMSNLKLSAVEGFTNNEYTKNVYLYLAYEEKEHEPVHSIASSAVSTEEVSEYNRVLEGYRLYIQEKAPEPLVTDWQKLSSQAELLYQDDKVRVMQISPNYVRVGEAPKVTLRVDRTVLAQPVSVQYSLLFVDSSGQTAMTTISFSEPENERRTEYVTEYALAMTKGASVISPNKHAYLRIDNGVKVKIGDRDLMSPGGDDMLLRLIDRPIEEQLSDDYLTRSLDTALDMTTDAICLAKISLITMKPTFVIENVQPVPFGEYVYGSPLLYHDRRDQHIEPVTNMPVFSVTARTETLDSNELPQLTALYEPNQNRMDLKLGWPRVNREAAEDPYLTTGVVDIQVQAYGKVGLNPFGRGEQTYCSAEIEHQHGAGEVMIVTALEESSNNSASGPVKKTDRQYFGQHDVFAGTEYASEVSPVQIGVLAYPSKGTFRVGVKLHGNSNVLSVRVRWWAYKNRQDSYIKMIHEAAAGNTE